jgi:hypothetical protein
VQEMRFVCDICGNKSYKNVTDYTNHLDSYDPSPPRCFCVTHTFHMYDHHHAKRMMEYKLQARGSDADRAAEREERAKREAKDADKEMKRMQQAAAAAAAAAEKLAAAAADKAAAAAAAAAAGVASSASSHRADSAADAPAAPVTVKFGLGVLPLPPLVATPPLSPPQHPALPS